MTGNGEARWGEHLWRCALGPIGVAAEKREGDGATPAGRFAFRRLLYPARSPGAAAHGPRLAASGAKRWLVR